MKTWINLMPPPFRRQQLLRRRVVQWGKVLCVGAVVGLLLKGYALREQQALADRLETLARQHEPIQTMLKQLIDMRERLEELEQQEVLARELEHQRQVLAVLGTIAQAAERSQGRLHVTEFRLADFQDRDAGSLELSGLSLDNGAVTELLDELQASEMFRRVELVLLREQRDGSQAALRDYAIRCEF